MHSGEAEIAASLALPGIAVVFDIDTDDGQLFLVMELIHGTDLAETTAPGDQHGRRTPPRHHHPAGGTTRAHA